MYIHKIVKYICIAPLRVTIIISISIQVNIGVYVTKY